MHGEKALKSNTFKQHPAHVYVSLLRGQTMEMQLHSSMKVVIE